MGARGRWATVCLVAGLLAALQYLILATPAGLVTSSPHNDYRSREAAYRLSTIERPGRDAFRLDLYGDLPVLRTGDVTLVGVANAASPDPVRAPSRLAVLGRDDRHSLLLVPKVPPGTYKIELPGYRPFGLVVVE